MNQRMIEEACIVYGESLIAPAQIDEIALVQELSDDGVDVSIYECSCDTMEEYWLIYEQSPCALIRKSGIYNTPQRAYEAYLLQKEEQAQKVEVKDRFAYVEE